MTEKQMTPIQARYQGKEMNDLVRDVNARLQDFQRAILSIVRRIEALEAKVNQ